jgi:GntR family transcriptional regulator, gluconate operon transcriptional repressor
LNKGPDLARPKAEAPPVPAEVTVPGALERSSLAEQTLVVLRDLIVSGKLRQSEKISEAGLARQLKVSRGPIREAMKQLVAEGLVREEPWRGSFVVELTQEDLAEILDLRAALEQHAVVSVVRTNRAQAAKELQDYVSEMHAAAEANDGIALARLDLDFHEAICRLSGNKRLHRAFTREGALLGTLMRIELETDMLYPNLDDLAREHEVITTAITAGKPGEARRLLREHHRDSHSLLLRLGMGEEASGA